MLTTDHYKLITQNPRTFLSQCYRTQERIRVKERRIKQLEALSVQITSTIKPVSAYTGPGDKIGSCAIEIVDLTREIETEIRKLMETEALIAEAIDFLVPDVMQRAILEARYLAGMRWEEIAFTYHYAYRWVLRLHKKALTAMKENAEVTINAEEFLPL